MAKVGIVIPAYNAAGFLAETLQSVIAQTRTDWELVVVDDGSTDDTRAIAGEFAKQDKRLQVIRQANAGTAVARNTAAESLRDDCEFVLFLDHDDLLEPDALDSLLAALNGSPASVAAHGLARKVDRDGSPIGEGEAAIQNYHRRKLMAGRVVNADRNEPTTALMVVYDNLICTPGTALIRRSAIRELTKTSDLLFDPSCAPLDDWDFWLRLTRLGNIAFLDRVVLRWRRHENAGSLNVAAMDAAGLRIRERLTSENLPHDLAEVAAYRYHRLLATERRRAARQALSAGDWPRGLREYLGYIGLRLARR